MGHRKIVHEQEMCWFKHTGYDVMSVVQMNNSSNEQ